MAGDPPEAAVRLAARLPVVTHMQKEPDARKLGRAYAPGSGVYHTGKSVKIGANVYGTIREARTDLGCSTQTIYKMIVAGTAEYI